MAQGKYRKIDLEYFSCAGDSCGKKYQRIVLYTWYSGDSFSLYQKMDIENENSVYYLLRTSIMSQEEMMAICQLYAGIKGEKMTRQELNKLKKDLRT